MPSFHISRLRSILSRTFLWSVIGGFLLLSGTVLCQSGKATVSPARDGSARLVPAVPMAFEENEGQLASDLSYLGRAQSYSVAIERDRLRFLIPGSGATPGSTWRSWVQRRSPTGRTSTGPCQTGSMRATGLSMGRRSTFILRMLLAVPGSAERSSSIWHFPKNSRSNIWIVTDN